MTNLCQYAGQRNGHYEVWFVTLNDPATRCGFWFRYTLDAPRGTDRAVPRVWAFFFDGASRADAPSGGGPPFGIVRTCESWRADSATLSGSFVAGASGFSDGSLYGALADGEHEIAWDVRFEPSPATFDHVAASVRKLVRPKSLICAPSLATTFSGTIAVDGRTFALDGAPGCQQHLWGRKHAEAWAWAHCNAFDGEPDAVFEGLAARTRVGPMTLPYLTLAYLRHGGEEFRFNLPRHIAAARNRLGEYAWSFTAGDARVRLHGEAGSRPERFVQVEYPDPDGDRTFCINSEIGDLTLAIERRSGSRWREAAVLRSTGTTHFELASRARHPGVALVRSNGREG